MNPVPDYIRCAHCRKQISGESPLGWGICIRSRTRVVDGDFKLPDGSAIVISESPDVCSRECFNAVVTHEMWRQRELADTDGLLHVRGEWVHVIGADNTPSNVKAITGPEIFE